MVGKKRSGGYLKFVIYLVVVVLVNIAGITLFYRMDLTANKIYSISAASKKVVASLSEPLTINVFFTKDLPPPHNNTERYLHDLLAEYAIYSNQYFNYRFYDVAPKKEKQRIEPAKTKIWPITTAFIPSRFRPSKKTRLNSKELTWVWL